MIYTIGYSTRTLPEFLNELQKYQITKIIDVRSRPWSRNAAFNAVQIERWSTTAAIMYQQAGNILGGDAGIDLDDDQYQSALIGIMEAAKTERIAIFCAEGDPALCHRTWDIGASLLLKWGVSSTNILRDGALETVEATIHRIRRSNFAPVILKAIDDMRPLDYPENLWLR